MNIQLILLRKSNLLNAPMVKADLNVMLELQPSEITHCSSANNGDAILLKDEILYVVNKVIANNAILIHVTEQPMLLALAFAVGPKGLPEVVFFAPEAQNAYG